VFKLAAVDGGGESVLARTAVLACRKVVKER
jgi:hypothetical protein